MTFLRICASSGHRRGELGEVWNWRASIFPLASLASLQLVRAGGAAGKAEVEFEDAEDARHCTILCNLPDAYLICVEWLSYEACWKRCGSDRIIALSSIMAC